MAFPDINELRRLAEKLKRGQITQAEIDQLLDKAQLEELHQLVAFEASQQIVSATAEALRKSPRISMALELLDVTIGAVGITQASKASRARVNSEFKLVANNIDAEVARAQTIADAFDMGQERDAELAKAKLFLKGGDVVPPPSAPQIAFDPLIVVGGLDRESLKQQVVIENSGRIL